MGEVNTTTVLRTSEEEKKSSMAVQSSSAPVTAAASIAIVAGVVAQQVLEQIPLPPPPQQRPRSISAESSPRQVVRARPSTPPAGDWQPFPPLHHSGDFSHASHRDITQIVEEE